MDYSQKWPITAIPAAFQISAQSTVYLGDLLVSIESRWVRVIEELLRMSKWYIVVLILLMFLPAYSIIILFTVIIVSFTTRIDFFFGSIHLLLNNANIS